MRARGDVYICTRCIFVIHYIYIVYDVCARLLFPMKRKIKVKLNCMQFVRINIVAYFFCCCLLAGCKTDKWLGSGEQLKSSVEQLGCSRETKSEQKCDMEINTHFTSFHSISMYPIGLFFSSSLLLKRNAISISVFRGK